MVIGDGKKRNPEVYSYREVSAIRAAKDFLARGWKPVPIPSKEKNPFHSGWQLEEITTKNVGEKFKIYQNIGVQFGRVSNGLCDVDLDCAEARELAPYFLPETNARFGRKSSPNSHWLYVTDLWETARNATEQFFDPDPKGDGPHGACMVELRIGGVKKGKDVGAVSLSPPSLHPSLERVAWVPPRGEPTKIDGQELRRRVMELAAATLLVRHYPTNGQRNKPGLVLGGVLARAGMTADEAAHFAETVALVAHDKDWKKRGKAARSAVEKFNNDEAIPGIPRMREEWGEKVANCVAKWLGVRSSPVSEDDDDDDQVQPHKQQKQTDTIIALADDAELFLGTDDVGYADMKVNNHWETWPIEGVGFKRWLRQRYFEREGGAPGGEPLRSAISTIEARARFGNASKRKICLRVGSHKGKYYIDLADDEWRAVEIDGDGWRVIDRAPIRFRRTRGMLPLPVPTPGGTLDDLRPFLNLKTDDDFVLVVAWMLAALRDRGPYPFLKAWGEPGSAKSTMFEFLRALTDPNKVPKRQLPRDVRDLHVAANNGHVLSYDNISGTPKWLSDGLCSLATGGGFATRALYTDGDEHLFEGTRPVMLNGVDNFPTRFDFAERCIVIELQRITNKRRKLEEELKVEFASERARIFGALLDLMSDGIHELPNTHSEVWPRMADFARWATACLGAEVFPDAYKHNRVEANRGAIEDDMVANAIRSLLTTDNPWKGNMSELLWRLGRIVGERTEKSKDWPTDARDLRSRVENAKASLRRIGIKVDKGKRTNKGREVVLSNTNMGNIDTTDTVDTKREKSTG